jgi:hypothetical protein
MLGGVAGSSGELPLLDMLISCNEDMTSFIALVNGDGVKLALAPGRGSGEGGSGVW